MHILEIILEGFKTYSTKTVISGFDPQFNAITGLNGSGKSNILDAILFVLGINKEWETLRVKNAQELVYKFGHAGVTKAEVCIVFDNKNKEQSPMGYEHYDQIQVTRTVCQGKSKFFINGANEKLKKVKHLFRSVQLNVDNPHFLVAQGRITKIVNLRPTELISMLEETAGTALYNDKKRESQAMIQKKEEKVNEINDLLKQEIEPQMEKFRRQHEQYKLWKSGESRVNELTKMLRGYEFWSKTQILDERQSEIGNLKREEQSKKNELKRAKQDLIMFEKEREKYMKDQSKDSDNKFKKIQEEYNNLKSEMLKIENDLKHTQERIRESDKDKQKFDEGVRENQANILRIQKKIQYTKQNLGEVEEGFQKKKELLDELEQNSRSNNSVEDARNQIENQISDNKQNSQAIQSEIKKYVDQIKDMEAKIKEQKVNFEGSEKEARDLDKQLEILERELNELNAQFNRAGFDEQALEMKREEKRRIDNHLMSLQHQLSQFEEQRGNMIFKLKYKDPEPGFDHRKVYGRVFNLFQVRDNSFLKALEAGAGGKLQNVVLDNEATGALLINKRCFHYHVNLIPNNKVLYKQVQRNVYENAQKIAQELGGEVWLPLDLINFNQQVKNSMLHIFGGWLICSKPEISSQIVFHSNPNMRVRCVNIQGDILDPSGVLTGGYVDHDNMILKRLDTFNRINGELEHAHKKQREIIGEIERFQREQVELDGIKQDIENKNYQYDRLVDQKNQSSRGNRLKDRIDNYEKEIVDMKEQINKLEAREQVFLKEIAELEQEKGGLSQEKDLKGIYSEKLQQCEQEIQAIKQEIKSNKDEITQLDLDRENSEKEIQNLQQKKIKEEKDYEDTLREVRMKEERLAQTKRDFKDKQADKIKRERELQSIDSKLNELRAKIDSYTKKIEEVSAEEKKIEKQVINWTQEIKELRDSLDKLVKNFEFIETEKGYFGEIGSKYDFTHFDYDKEQVKLNNLKHEQEQLQKRINFKVDAMREKVDNQYSSLIEKRKILTEDKNKLIESIIVLDQKQEETLEKCYLFVNEHFGKIFGDLLKGAFAKIEMIEGKDLSDGLQMKVAFNGHWKTSLSELSGGQRSLLALSFVLSLLLYKPAPFYILDQVDSALDLSHTQNIGLMISQNFPQSQFILISLKDGMYNNANTLFKVALIDKVSQVERHVLNKNKQQKEREMGN